MCQVLYLEFLKVLSSAGKQALTQFSIEPSGGQGPITSLIFFSSDPPAVPPPQVVVDRSGPFNKDYDA